MNYTTPTTNRGFSAMKVYLAKYLHRDKSKLVVFFKYLGWLRRATYINGEHVSEKTVYKIPSYIPGYEEIGLK